MISTVKAFITRSRKPRLIEWQGFEAEEDKQFLLLFAKAIEHDDKLWIPAQAPGEFLGYTSPEHSVCRLFERHRDEFLEGDLRHVPAGKGNNKEVPALAPAAALMLGALSRQSASVVFRRWGKHIFVFPWDAVFYETEEIPLEPLLKLVRKNPLWRRILHVKLKYLLQGKWPSLLVLSLLCLRLPSTIDKAEQDMKRHGVHALLWYSLIIPEFRRQTGRAAS